MTIKNTRSLFKHIHTSVLNEAEAAAFSKKAGARVQPGDELRMYADLDGAPAQAILSRTQQECAVAYTPKGGFLWGLLLEIGDRAILVGDGDPCVNIDLQDLSFTSERVS
jgi:hypothetical protein